MLENIPGNYESAKNELTAYVENCGLNPDDFKFFEYAVRELTEITKKETREELTYDDILKFWDNLDFDLTADEFEDFDNVWGCVWRIYKDHETGKYYIDDYDQPDWNYDYDFEDGDTTQDVINDLLSWIAASQAEHLQGWGEHNVQVQTDYDIYWSWETVEE